MNALPTPESLAVLVSGVTEMMLGMSFSLAPPGTSTPPDAHKPEWHTVLLPLVGGRSVTVAIAADDVTGKRLGSKMFSCEEGAVDHDMLLDTLRELANIIAGQIKSAMGLNQALGLPVVMGRGESMERPWRAATLSSGSTQQVFWVAIAEA